MLTTQAIEGWKGRGDDCSPLHKREATRTYRTTPSADRPASFTMVPLRYLSSFSNPSLCGKGDGGRDGICMRTGSSEDATDAHPERSERQKRFLSCNYSLRSTWCDYYCHHTMVGVLLLISGSPRSVFFYFPFFHVWDFTCLRPGLCFALYAFHPNHGATASVSNIVSSQLLVRLGW